MYKYFSRSREDTKYMLSLYRRGSGWKAIKEFLSKSIIETLSPIRSKMKELDRNTNIYKN